MVYLASAKFGEFMKPYDANNGAALTSLGREVVCGAGAAAQAQRARDRLIVRPGASEQIRFLLCLDGPVALLDLRPDLLQDR